MHCYGKPKSFLLYTLLHTDFLKKINFYLSGPLRYYDERIKAVVVIGVVSFGFGCASRNTPGYYARVNQVLPWINDVIKNSSACPPLKFTTTGFERNSSRDSSITSSAPPTWGSVSDKDLVNFWKRSFTTFSIPINITLEAKHHSHIIFLLLKFSLYFHLHNIL